MKNIVARLSEKNWQQVTDDMHNQGYAILPDVLDKTACEQLIGLYEADITFRKTITIKRYRFGMGEYKYFQYPLPDVVTAIRETVYPHIAPIAN